MEQYTILDFHKHIATNSINCLTFFNKQGELISKPYAEVFRDIRKTLIHMREFDIANSGTRFVVCGEPSYHWVCVALAAILNGAQLVALPESMSEEEMLASIDGLNIESALVADKYKASNAFASVKTFELSDFCEQTRAIDCDDDTALGFMLSDKVIAFTSGSTAEAKFKAFEVPLQTSIAFTDRFRKLYSINKEDNWLICHSFSHIVHFEYLLGGLYWGYNVTIATAFQMLMKGASFSPSVLVTVPSVYEQIASQIRNKFRLAGDGEKKLHTLEARPVSNENGDVIRYPLCDEAKLVLGDKLKMLLIGASPSSLELQTFLLQTGLPLYEGYGMTELNMISCNTPKKSKLSTVGPAWPGIEIKLDDDNCILARATPERACFYLNADQETNQSTFLENGWVNTQDLGRIDNGVLHIVGRKKDIIVNAGGKNISPSAIETKLTSIPIVNHAVVYGDMKPYLVAVLSSTEKDRFLLEDIQHSLDRINTSLPLHERIMGFILSEEPFTEEGGTLTRLGKVRRTKVIEQYQEELEKLYA